jgi:hypothetical protein
MERLYRSYKSETFKYSIASEAEREIDALAQARAKRGIFSPSVKSYVIQF